MVGANTFREPALTAKMATTLDHISGGRAILGIGAAWFEDGARRVRHPVRRAGFPERLRWLGEALPVMRGMLHGERPTATGPRYAAKDVRNDPPPLQERLPLLVGGGGEQVTLKLVARYARRQQRRGRLENVRRKEAILAPALRDGRPRSRRDRADDRHRHGRHPRLARRGGAGPALTFERNGNADAWTNQPVGTPEDVAETLAPFLELGYRHLVAGFPSPVRRGIDDAPRDRGPAAARARLTGADGGWWPPSTSRRTD